MRWIVLLTGFLFASPFTHAADQSQPAAHHQPPGTHNVKLNGQTFTLPLGFEIDLAATAPLVDRPVHADFDEQGRLYIADSSGSNDKPDQQLKNPTHRIVRLEDTDGDGRYDKHTVYAEKVMFPEGAMWYAGSLYVAAPPSIWKFTDTDGDGVADQRTEWFKGKTLTGCANDLHGPYVGLDGWIYWAKGAFAEQTYERPGKTPFVTRAAHLFRSRPDGSGIEPVMTGGMDNPVEIVFTPGGERIFSTTFLTHSRGTTRDGLIHAIYGGVYGKDHGVIEGHPRTGDLMPTLSHMGAAAPAGLVRYTGLAFGPEYRHNLFAAQFSPHKISRHALTPDGATFKSQDSDFLVSDNLDFHPTDVLDDADGSLLVFDTGGWYKLCCPSSQLSKPDMLGAVYRIRKTGAPKVTDPRGLQIPWAQQSPEQLAQLLTDPRPAVVERAGRTLSRLGAAAVPALTQLLQASNDPAVRLQAVWALARIDDAAAQSAVRTRLSDNDSTVRQAAIHAVSVRRDSAAVPQLLTVLKNSDLHNRRAAAEALGRLGATQAIPLLLEQAGQKNDRILEHSLTYALIEIAQPALTQAGLNTTNPHTLRTTLIALDQMPGGKLDPNFVAPLLASKDPLLKETAIWLVDRHPDWGSALATFLRQRLTDKGLTNSDSAELSLHLARLAKDPAIQALIVEALSSPESSQLVRLTVLSAIASSHPTAIPAGWEAALIPSLSSSQPMEVLAALAAAKSLAAVKPLGADITAALLTRVRDGKTEEALRLIALTAASRSLVSMDPGIFVFALSQLEPDDPIQTRLTAVECFSRVKLDLEQQLTLTDRVRTATPLEIERLLEAFINHPDPQVRGTLAEALENSPALSAVRPETLQKLFPPTDAVAKPIHDRVLAKLNERNRQQREKLEQLAEIVKTGDVRRGQLVFNSQKAACTSCHTIGYRGGDVGPNLTRIGQIRSDRDLLESIVFPSLSFVRSYEPVTVSTRSGKTHGGILKGDNPQDVVIRVNAQEEVRIPRDQIEEILPGTVSVMPAGLDQQLSPQDLADLVTFLRACR
ncbi:MAG: PVC-type heme-binding CxxCH protein [Planctomycetales bacterium]